MTRELATVITLVAVAIALAVAVWAWRRRVRRDAHLVAPAGVMPAGAVIDARFPGLYVATTRAGEPLERLAIRGLTFRAKADLTVADAGVLLEATGSAPILLSPSLISGVGQATLAIDRVVEPGGLVRLSWRIDERTDVDSYFRPQQSSAVAVVEAIRRILPVTTGAAE